MRCSAFGYTCRIITEERMACFKTMLVLLAALGSLQYVCDAQEGAVRLINGPTKNCGRVEVFHDDEWGTVCDDSWHYRDADVVCKQLGYGRTERRYSSAHFGEGDGPIWLDNLRCSSLYTSIMQCRHRGWGIHDCTHKEDAGVCCKREPAPKPQSLPVRLTCPQCSEYCTGCPDKLHPDPTDCSPQPTVSGIVEVQVNGEWGPLSAESWNAEEATVVCGELGYPITFPVNADPLTNGNVWPESASEFSFLLSSGSGGVSSTQRCTDVYSYELQQLYNSFSFTFLQELECSGKESRLLDCFFSGIGSQTNPTHRVAAVQCGFKPHHSCLNKTIRLRAGPVPWQGRIEVFKNGKWGTVCDSGFDSLDGNVVCRQLGYGSTKTIYSRGGSGRGVGAIHFTQCRCAGTEGDLGDCGCTGDRAESCGHRGDVGIECNIPEECSGPTYNMQVGMLEVADPSASWITRTYPEISMETTGWGLFCTPIVTKEVGEVICRETKGYFLARILKGSRPINYHMSFYDGKIDCTGDEATLSECNVNVYTVHECRDGYVMIDCSSVAADLVLDVSQLQRSLESRYYVERLPLYLLQCALEEDCLSTSAYGAANTNDRTLLRFDSMAWNWGLTDFRPAAPPEDWIWHTCHNHYHSIEAFVHYDLIDETTGRKVAEGHKASFCLEDSQCDGNYSPRYSCFHQVQGISTNCADLYGSHLDCQWIDITGVPAGQYLLQLTVNPNHLVVESDYKNNQANCRIELAPSRYGDSLTLRVDDCWLSDH